MTQPPLSDAEFAALLDGSSLGTDAAQALRAAVTDGVRAELMRRIKTRTEQRSKEQQ